MKEARPIPLGAQLISLEIAVVALLQVMARAQPATAQLVAATMEDIANLIPEKYVPQVWEKVEQYVEVIDAEMTASSRFTSDAALSGQKRKRALQ